MYLFLAFMTLLCLVAAGKYREWGLSVLWVSALVWAVFWGFGLLIEHFLGPLPVLPDNEEVERDLAEGLAWSACFAASMFMTIVTPDGMKNGLRRIVSRESTSDPGDTKLLNKIIIDLYKQGHSLGDIAELLNKRGYRSSDSGNRFSEQSVKRELDAVRARKN